MPKREHQKVKMGTTSDECRAFLIMVKSHFDALALVLRLRPILAYTKVIVLPHNITGLSADLLAEGLYPYMGS